MGGGFIFLFQLVNLCSNDGQRFFEVMVNGPFILAGPVIFLVGSVYLGFLIGPWALLGCATYLAFFILLVRQTFT